MSILSTGRRGTNCPDRGTQGLPRYFYWKQLLKSIQRMPRAWVKPLNKCDVTQAAFTPRIWAIQHVFCGDGDMVTWWAAEAIALAKRQAGPCWVTFWKVTHCTMTPHFWDCSWLVGGLEHLDDFSIYWECHHPNWRIHIFQRGRYTTNQMSFSWFLIILYSFGRSETCKFGQLASCDGLRT